MVAMEQTSKPIQSLHRAFEILELLSECPSGMALTVLAQQTGLSKSTTHRFLSSLREMGYVAQDANTGKYRQTLRMFEIGSRSVRALSILEIARPYLHDLMEKTGETVHLVTHEHDKVLYIYKNSYISDVPFNTGSLIGNCSPLYCTGVGKAILANLPASKVEQIWESSSIIQYTKNTIVSLDELKNELNRIRSRGYAMDNEEHEPGVSCVAVPIFDFSGAPKYAMSVTAPTVRLDEEKRAECIGLLQRASREISKLLGFSPLAIPLRIPGAAQSL